MIKNLFVIALMWFAFMTVGFSASHDTLKISKYDTEHEYASYVAPDGTYKCIFSTFPGISIGTVATWHDNVWTVNGVSYPGGASGDYSPIKGGFRWTNGYSTCMWIIIGP